jgi:hypothetical protein
MSLGIVRELNLNPLAQFNTTSCNLEGSGKVAYVATGWAWFNYNDKTHDHYKCMSSLATDIHRWKIDIFYLQGP